MTQYTMEVRPKILSIVVPVFQNQDNLDDSIPRLLALEAKLPGYRLELVFVDDGSTDGSWKILSSYRQREPERLVLVRLARNFGQSPAIQAGLRHSTGDCVAIISADLQEPPEQLVEMIRHWENGAKFIIGERVARTDGAWKSFIAQFYWRIVHRSTWRDYPAMGYDFCLLDRQVVQEVDRINEKNTAIFSLIYWLGYRDVRVPIARSRREKGRSQWGLFKRIRFYFDTVIAFTYLPVRFVTAVGLIASVLAFTMSVYIMVNRVFHGTTVQGWTSIASLILVFGALTIFSLGIICEYLWRILDAARGRPPFVVDTVERSSP